jgi:hypothetical protein
VACGWEEPMAAIRRRVAEVVGARCVVCGVWCVACGAGLCVSCCGSYVSVSESVRIRIQCEKLGASGWSAGRKPRVRGQVCYYWDRMAFQHLFLYAVQTPRHVTACERGVASTGRRQ